MPSTTPESENTWNIATGWQVPRQTPTHLAQNMTCDTLIIGAGITGLSIAAELARKGRNPIVIDAKQISEGSTGWCGGILSLDTCLELSLLESMFGPDQAQLLVTRLTESLLKQKQLFGPECDWQQGTSICFASKKRHMPGFEDEITLRQQYGLGGQLIPKSSLSQTWSGFNGAFTMTNEHAVHPVKLTMSMVKQITTNGGSVFENTRCDKLTHNGKHFIITCGTYTIEAENVVMCQGLNGITNDELGDFRKLLVPVTGHVLITAPSDDAKSLSEKYINFWDSLQLYHYGRYFADGRILIGGEETPGITPGLNLAPNNKRIQTLYAWAQKHHNFKLPPIESAWKASLVIPFDGMPVLKSRQVTRNSKLVTAITDGLPSAFLLGETVSEVLTAGDSDLSQLLSQKRRLSLPGKLLSLSPSHPALRNATFQTAFATLQLWDWLT